MALHRAGQVDARHGFVESFNGRMGDELLNETQFRNLAHVRVVIAAWAADYNTEHPHSALDHETPADYARALTTAIARLGSREMITPRVGRLLNLRRSAHTPTGLRSWLDEIPMAGHVGRSAPEPLLDEMNDAQR